MSCHRSPTLRMSLLEIRTLPSLSRMRKTRPLDQEILEECDQLNSQPDEVRTVEESRAVEDVCIPYEKETEREPQVKSILSSVTFTDSPSFSEWVPYEKTDEHRMSLSNVEFRGCEQSGLQLKSSCDFANVTFIDCKFNRTVFMDVKLCDVMFVRVDFTDTTLYYVWLRNVRLLDTKFDRDVWRATSMRNALVGKHVFKLKPKSKREYGVGRTLASSKTKRLQLDSALSLDGLKQAVGCSENWKRDIYLCEPVPAAVDILTRLTKHEAIFDRSMGYCFPGSSVHIYEYPRQSKVPRETQMLQRLYPRTHSSMTTYFGSLQEGLSVTDKASGNVPRRGIGDCTGLTRANRRLAGLAYKHLYSRDFHLQCSAEGAMRFLLAHKRRITWMKQLVLYYHWADDQLGFATDIDAWRLLLCKIRHELAYIRNIRLHMGKSFWKSNKPALGVNRVLDDPKLCPLSEAYKFAAPADRWRFKGDDSTHRTDGTDLQIHIEGAGTQEEVEFVGELVAEIEERRVGRPLFVTLSKGEEIKYKCAEDFR